MTDPLDPRKPRIVSLSATRVITTLLESVRLGWAHYGLLCRLGILCALMAGIGNAIWPAVGLIVPQLISFAIWSIVGQLVLREPPGTVRTGTVFSIVFNGRFLRHALPAILFTFIYVSLSLLVKPVYQSLPVLTRSFLSFDSAFDLQEWLVSPPAFVIAGLLCPIIDYKLCYLILFRGARFYEALRLSFTATFKNLPLLLASVGSAWLSQVFITFVNSLDIKSVSSALGMNGLIIIGFGSLALAIFGSPFVTAFGYLLSRQIFAYDSDEIDMNQFYEPLVLREDVVDSAPAPSTDARRDS